MCQIVRGVKKNDHFVPKLICLGPLASDCSTPCHSCWMESRIKEVAPDRAGISRLIDLVKAIADSDVTFEEHE